MSWAGHGVGLSLDLARPESEQGENRRRKVALDVGGGVELVPPVLP
jgi:hypothetical protein